MNIYTYLSHIIRVICLPFAVIVFSELSADACTVLPTSSFVYKNKKIHHLEIQNNKLERSESELILIPQSENFSIQVDQEIPKIRVMFVGLYSSETISTISVIESIKNNVSWNNSHGNWTTTKLGSEIQNSNCYVGYDDVSGEPISVPLINILPFINPKDIAYTGWDISEKNLSTVVEQISNFDFDLIKKLSDIFEGKKALPTIITPQHQLFNCQGSNVIHSTLSEQLKMIQNDIQKFKKIIS